jgi:hypothetical protein
MQHERRLTLLSEPKEIPAHFIPVSLYCHSLINDRHKNRIRDFCAVRHEIADLTGVFSRSFLFRFTSQNRSCGLAQEMPFFVFTWISL